MAIENIPDYAACTLRELYLVLNHIDRERVPETYEALLGEIESRVPRHSDEALDAWRALDRERFPALAARLEEQIAALEREAAVTEPEPTRKEPSKYATFWRRLGAGIRSAGEAPDRRFPARGRNRIGR